MKSALLLLLAAAALVGQVAAARTTPRRLMVPAEENSSATGNSTAVGQAVPLGGATFTGDGTAYSDAVKDGSGFACSYRYLGDWAKVHFAAINNAQWADGANCGKGVIVKCIDSRCPVQGVEVPLMIVDKCPECSEGDLDLSFPAYREVTGSWPNRLKVSWRWADISSYIEGDMKMAPKDGSNDFWQAFYFANSKYPLANVTLDGKPLIRQQFNFWQHTAPLSSSGTHELIFTSINGKLARTEVPKSMLLGEGLRDLSIQFDP